MYLALGTKMMRTHANRCTGHYVVDFVVPPPLGTRIYAVQTDWELVAVIPCTRKRDGAASAILVWRSIGHDRPELRTSGLCSKGLSRVRNQNLSVALREAEIHRAVVAAKRVRAGT